MYFPSRRSVIIILAIAVFLVAIIWGMTAKDGNSVKYRTSTVKKGDLVSSISATGTVEPEELVDVGAQVAGKILGFGKDASGKQVDYGSVVEEGMKLAFIDDALYRYDRDQAKAQSDQAKADVKVAEAEMDQAKTKLNQTEREWRRTEKAGGRDVISDTDRDAAFAAYESAKSGLKVSEARVVQAKMALEKADALLKKAQQNLDYCTIISPVNGVIIDRRVNIGQTVVSSMSAPSLFLIAKDLKKLQIWVAVNEADIGSIREKQAVDFTVDARTGETFKGEVGKIRLNATMTQNVVTYTVEVNTDNSDGKLLPYLTANVSFIVNSKKDVLQVPNAALRWSPKDDAVHPDFRSKKSGGKPDKGLSDSKPGNGEPSEKKDLQLKSVVWVKDGKYVKPLNVKAGITDGTFTEISGQDIKEGTEIVTGEEVAEDGSSKNQGTSPFTPKFGRRPR